MHQIRLGETGALLQTTGKQPKALDLLATEEPGLPSSHDSGQLGRQRRGRGETEGGVESQGRFPESGAPSRAVAWQLDEDAGKDGKHPCFLSWVRIYGAGREEFGRTNNFALEPKNFARQSMIRLKRIYNFLCSMLVYAPFALCFVTLRGVFMHFLELTY
jgi:hypothetical protein